MMGNTAKQPDGKAQRVVLIADDEPSICKIAAVTLQEDGFLMLTACDGQDAVKISEQYSGPIHLLITDVRMPGMDGHTAAALITAQRKETKILLMSAYPLTETDTASFSFLPKPFTPSELRARVREMIGNGRKTAG